MGGHPKPAGRRGAQLPITLMYFRGHGSDSRGFLGIPEHLGSSAGRGKQGRRALRLGTGTMLTQWRLAPSRRTGLSDASLCVPRVLLSPDPDSSDISDDASGTKAYHAAVSGADRWPDSSLATTGGSSSGTVCLTDRSRRQDTRGGFFEVPASRAKRGSRRWAPDARFCPKGGASKSSKVAPSAWPSDPGLATSRICEKSMTNRQPTAQWPARSVALN